MIDKVAITRRICPVFFLLDTSGSMKGAPIGAVNAAMEGILPELVSMNYDNADIEIKIAVMTFNTAPKWETGFGLIDPETYYWQDINAGGLTAMGDAFLKLDEALSVNNGFMQEASGSVAPVLFLLSDGEPTDEGFEAKLEELKQNNWYKVAARVAVGYQDSNDAVLREFTGTSESVIHTNDPYELREWIKFISITSSMVASKGGTRLEDYGDDYSDDMTEAVVEELKGAPMMPPELPELSDAYDDDEVW